MQYSRREFLALLPIVIGTAYMTARGRSGEVIAIGQEHRTPQGYTPASLESQVGVFYALDKLRKEGNITIVLKEGSAGPYVPFPQLCADAKQVQTEGKLKDLLVTYQVGGSEVFAAAHRFPTEGYFTPKFEESARQVSEDSAERDGFVKSWMKQPMSRKSIARQILLCTAYEQLIDDHNRLLEERVEQEKGGRVAIVTGKVHFAYLKERTSITALNTPGKYQGDAGLVKLKEERQRRVEFLLRLQYTLQHMEANGLSEWALK